MGIFLNLKIELTILKHPQSIPCEYHTPVSLTVIAVGTGQLKYQWKRDGKKLTTTDPECTGVDTAALGITSVSDAHMGKYTCIIEDCHMLVESSPAQLDLGK